jgi:type VI secretion system ImpC/EvpB family protein/type VI secretion system ImpB/VipA family protein
MADAPGSPRSASLSFSFNTLGSKRPPRTEKAPFVIAVFGDFSGRANKGQVEALAGRTPQKVDVDSFEKAFSALAPSLVLDNIGEPDVVALGFNSLDDFHPDQLIPNLPTLARLRELRPQLLSASTAAKASAEVRTLLGLPLPPPARDLPAASESESEADTIARLLGRKPAPAAAAPTTAQSAAQSLIAKAVAGSVVATPTAQQQAVVAALDAVCTEHLRALLSHPHFQGLEAGWRALDRLVRVFDEGDNIQLRIFDISKDELAADLAADDVTTSGLYGLLYSAIGAEAWSAMVGNYTFGDSPEDVALVGKMTLIGAYLSTPWLAGGSPFLAGCAGFDKEPEPRNWTPAAASPIGKAWTAFRQKGESAFLGLALPRFLLRQPYGKGSDAIDTFAFEEIPEVGGHRSYLWGNSAFLGAQLLIEKFKEDAWAIDLRTGGELGDIPVHTIKQGGDVSVKPGAEAWLIDRTADTLRQMGLIPVLSVKGSDSVRILSLDSASLPARPLSVRLS